MYDKLTRMSMEHIATSINNISYMKELEMAKMHSSKPSAFM